MAYQLNYSNLFGQPQIQWLAVYPAHAFLQYPPIEPVDFNEKQISALF